MIKNSHCITTLTVRIILLAFSMLLTGACGEEDINGNLSVSDKEYLIGFRIDLGDGYAPSTRSTPSDGSYDDGRGTPFENYIDLDDYRVLFFDKQNRYIASFKPETLIPLEEDIINSKTYQATGTINKPLPEEFKVMMIANWQQYPSNLVAGQTTIDDICADAASQYTYSAPFILSENTPIPLYGIKLCENITLDTSETTFLGTLHLLRAMAKIEVKCATAGWEIENVMLHGHNTKGWCAPAGVYEERDYVKGSYNSDYADNIHIINGTSELDKDVAFNNAGDGRFIVYVPEYRNIAVSGEAAVTAATISVKFKKRDDRRYPIYFKYYNNPPEGKALGDAFDIKRNYYYKFTINKSDENAEPEISIDLYPYEVVDLDPIFGNDK